MPTARLLKSLLVFFVLFIFLFFFKGEVLAQSQNPYAPDTNPDVPKNLHTYTQSVMIELASSLACQLGGVDPTDPNAKCLGVDHATGKIGYVENGGGLLAVFSYMIASTYNNPVRSGDYVNYLASNFGLEKKAYATSHDIQKPCDQAFGLGYCGIFPLINIWATMRNMIYLLFVVIFMAIGLGIMLRIHIDPRTVMAVENQIPKIIVAIILATFSFAIAGFMVDIMYAVIFLVFSVFNSIPNTSLDTLTPQILQNSSALGIGSNLAGDNPAGIFAFTNTISWNVTEIFRDIFNLDKDLSHIINPLEALGNIFGRTFGAGDSPLGWLIDIISLGTAATVGAQISGVAKLGVPLADFLTAGAVFGLVFEGVYVFLESSLRVWIPFIIVYLVLLFAVLFALFRLWFSLIQAYIFFLMNVVAAPFWMLVGLFPGSKLGVSAWFREIAADLSAFVVAIVMFWLGKLFIDAFGCVPIDAAGACETQVENFFFPPLIGTNPSANVIGSIIAIGTILSVPDAVKIARAAFKPPEIDLKAAAAALGAGRSVAGGTAKEAGASTFTGMFGALEKEKQGGLTRIARRFFLR